MEIQHMMGTNDGMTGTLFSQVIATWISLTSLRSKYQYTSEEEAPVIPSWAVIMNRNQPWRHFHDRHYKDLLTQPGVS
jgi:hypothetical protein